jgi:anthranilate synthase component 1
MLTFDEFKALAAGHNVIPIVRRSMADTLTPVSAYLILRKEGVASFILESVEPDEKIGRYSFIGTDPRMLIRARGTHVTIEEDGGTRSAAGSIFETVRQVLDRYRVAPFSEPHGLMGGVVGYIGYNAIRSLERIAIAEPSAGDEDDAILGLFGTILQFDHRLQVMTIIHNAFVDPTTSLESQYDAACRTLEEFEQRLRHPPSVSTVFSCSSETDQEEPDRATFLSSVTRAKEFITEGDIFQVVLSRRLRRQFSGDVFAVYRALRMINPSPYLFYLDFGRTKLAGSSPEVLVRSRDRNVEVLPIAGTRRRGDHLEEDDALEVELLADAKELAEHVMLVDLGRNDVGRIAEYGSVHVPVFKRVDRYSHVMHIVSEVHGRLREGLSQVDTLEACFPAGTVSGAPKVRAMEIINELETCPRGAYAGAAGYFGLDGVLETCIAIRTIIAHGNMLKIQSGAGIVADSDPAREYDETVSKARALLEAVDLASAGLLSPRLTQRDGRRAQ